MADGQDVLTRTLDVAALDKVENRLAAAEAARGQAHAEQLRAVLAADRIHRAAGHDLNTVPQAALVLGCSDARAHQLLADAQLLDPLDGAIEAVECGLLGVESSRRLVDVLTPLPFAQRVTVWHRLRARLIDAAERGVVLPPERVAELLRRWVVETDPAGAEQRRREAHEKRSVEHRRRADDGLVDLYLLGLTGPDAQACLQSIRRHAEAHSSADTRSADQRRLDAARDLLLGRIALPFGEQHCAPGCDCRPLQPAPCGADVTLLVPQGAALHTTNEAAELVGHGPIEPDLLHDILLAAPVLRAAFVDEHGVPVAMSPLVERPQRGDAASVRAAVLRLVASQPGPHQPRHPGDHASPPDRGGGDPPPAPPEPPHPAASVPDPVPPRSCVAGAHPPGTAGAYRPAASLRRFLAARAPRSEWPGGGARASRCDLDHDVAWPLGPTCACNLGPLNRHEHQVKQLDWTKLRAADGTVRWTSPSGKTWSSAPQHCPPQLPVRPPAALPAPPTPLDELSPLALDEALWQLDPGSPIWDDPVAHELRAIDLEPDDVDPTPADTCWTTDLDDPYSWQDLPHPAGA